LDPIVEAPMHKNTFPPLISGTSVDFLGQRQLLGGRILDSLTVKRTSTDLFFNPQGGLTGFGADGYYYEKGQKDPSRVASWFEEPLGPTRGPLKSFPSGALVLLTDASISIMDITDLSMNMWMLFIRTDLGAFAHNFQNAVAGYIATKLSYVSGGILVNLTPDIGSTVKGSAVLVIDFINDGVRIDFSIDTNTTPVPNQTTGFLQDEVNWLKRMADPLFGMFGRVTRIPKYEEVQNFTDNRSKSILAWGEWSVFGYTPQKSTTPVISVGGDELFSGNCCGYINYFDPPHHEGYLVRVGNIVNGTLEYTGQALPDESGAWGPVTAGTGVKIAEVYDLATGMLLGNSMGEVWDVNYEMHHFLHPDRESPGVWKATTPVAASGRWDFDGVNVQIPTDIGYWSVELVRKSDKRVMAQTGMGSGLVRSWKVPDSDSRYTSLKNLCHIEDQVMALLVAAAPSVFAKDPNHCYYLLQGLMQVQNADGSWNVSYDSSTGIPLNESHKTLLATATACYGLAFVLRQGLLSPLATEEAKAALLGGIQFTETLRVSMSSPLDGLYLDGNGLYDPNGGYVEAAPQTCSLIPMVWLLLALATGGPILNYGFNQYDNLRNRLDGLWLGDRYALAMSPSGLDTRDTAMNRLFGGILDLHLETGNFEQSYQTFLVKYARYTAELNGYTNYMAPDYESAEQIWTPVTQMSTMVATRTDAGSRWPKATLVSLENRDYDSGWVGGYLFRNIGNWSEWANVEATAWAVIAHMQGLRGAVLESALYEG
jgi:hypothetical protein